MNSKKKTPRFYAAMAEAKALIGVMQRLGRNANRNLCSVSPVQMERRPFPT